MWSPKLYDWKWPSIIYFEVIRSYSRDYLDIVFTLHELFSAIYMFSFLINKFEFNLIKYGIWLYSHCFPWQLSSREYMFIKCTNYLSHVLCSSYAYVVEVAWRLSNQFASGIFSTISWFFCGFSIPTEVSVLFKIFFNCI
jgi:hypothetical protein